MCGIAGIISEKPIKSTLKRMLSAQAHRGPDHTGTYFDAGFAGLGHNRLAIIDLSTASNQPFWNFSDRYVLTFNGEIYNYRELREELESHFKFRTASDTEVLLAAYIHWGRLCLEKLNGMFSFGIWDNQKKKLFAARDRFGVKPFYYSQEGKDFYFSSEIKSIQAAVGKKNPNEGVWASYFAYGTYGMPDETFFEGIHQLPGGHFLEVSNGNFRTEKWYDFKRSVKKIDSTLSLEKAKGEYFELLKESISLRFRADVPVGFNLSGGVDSSLLLALVNLTQERQHVKAYSFYTGDKRYDELPWVEEMIATTQNPLQKVKLNAEEVELYAGLIAKFQDEPFGGIPSLAYAKLFERAKQEGVKVLLDGQGMDEQWAGYDYYAGTASGILQGQRKNSSPYKTNVLKPEFLELAERPVYPEPFDGAIQNKQYRDLFYTKIPRALRFNDRISMAYSTELREPFLDYRLVEFAFAQPEEFKIKEGSHKFLLRELAKELVPREISYAPKRPLQTPQREWLAEELKDFVIGKLEFLKSSAFSHWFDHKEMEREWQAYLNGNRESSFHIWQWVNRAL